MEKIKLKLMGISEIVGIDDIALLGLIDEVHQRQIVVTCDKNMRLQIQRYMMNKPELNKCLPKVMGDVLNSLGLVHVEIHLLNIHDGEYETELVDTVSGRNFPIRCSDGILFAIANDYPIYASYTLMATQSVPFKVGETKIGLPLTVLSENMLKMSLQKAIETENFEMASNLRDELKRRHSQNEQQL